MAAWVVQMKSSKIVERSKAMIGRIGAEYAAYVTLLMPIIALLLSTIFEDFIWTTHAAMGVVIVLVGNLFILTPAETLTRAYRRVRPI